MPGFVTHYLFGEEIYHQLKCNFQKKNLFYNRSAYAFGLQGPDLFFYYLPSYALHRHNLGALPKPTSPVSWGTICSTPHAIPISMP